MKLLPLAIILLSCGTALVAADCVPFNVTYDVPAVCMPTYDIPSITANTSANDLLYFYLSSINPRPTEACTEAFLQYYCGVFYPECNEATGSNKGLCATACRDAVTACADDASKFTHPLLPLPNTTTCSHLSTDTSVCAAPPPVNVTEWYTECGALNDSLFIDPYNDNRQLQTQVLCTPKYQVQSPPNYIDGLLIFQTFANFSMEINLDPAANSTPEYPCMKALVNFLCASHFPKCPANNVRPDTPYQVCASVCRQAMSTCTPDWNGAFNRGPYYVPDSNLCEYYFSDTNCFIPDNTDTNLGFFYGGNDPPVIQTESSSSQKENTTDDSFDARPGGAMEGGAIGGGIIVGILLFIGFLTLIMKKQDSK